MGTNLCGYLTERGHVCEALDVPAARRENVPYAAFHTWDGLEEIDFAQFDAVVHLAGKAHDLKKVASEQSYFDVNVGLTQRVFDTMVRQARERGGAGRGRRVFVHFSSSKASADGNAYGRSKLAAERWLLSVPAAGLGLGLEDKMQVRMGALSGGQRQALSLLMATMNDIDLLLLDEHTAALDPKTADLIMELTDRIVREKQLTALMVTHNLRHAVTYGDRLLMMHQGHVIMDKAGDEKRALKVDDLLDVFTSISIECGN